MTWAAIRGGVLGVGRGALRILNLPMQAHAITGEIVTDQLRQAESAISAEAPDKYVGWYEPLGARMSELENTNFYRQLRATTGRWVDETIPLPKDPRLAVQVAAGVGEALPQLALLAEGAAAARGFALAGNTARAVLTRGAAMGTMFALEGSDGYTQYLQYAEQKGLPPEEAAKTALLGALVYASAATALEYAGPFMALEKRLPGIKRRLLATGLMAATEGGTEFLQSVTQEALAYGMDLRNLNWPNIQSSLQQASMEGIVGAIAGGAIGGVTFSPQVDGAIEMEVVDPNLTAEVAREMVQEVDAKFMEEAVTEAEAPVAEPVAEAPVTVEAPVAAEPLSFEDWTAQEPTIESELIAEDEGYRYEAEQQYKQYIEMVTHPVAPAVPVVPQTPEDVPNRDVQADVGIEPIELTEQPPEHPLRRLASDEEGMIDPIQLVETLSRTIQSATDAVGDGKRSVITASNGVYQSNRPLERTPEGRLANRFMQQVYHQGRFDASQALAPFYQVLQGLKQKGEVIRWAMSYREDGQTNWSTLIEHPERMQDETLPTGATALRDAYIVGYRHSGQNATDAKVVQHIMTLDKEGKVQVEARIFQPSRKIRYQRQWTSIGRDLMRLRDAHPLWGVLLEWHQTHPERNPNLPTDPDQLRETLKRAATSANTQKVGALEFVRVWEELPVALKNPRTGQWVDIQQAHPVTHHEINMQRESQRAAMYRVGNDMLFHYGEGFRLKELDTVDLDMAVDRMRLDVGRGATAANRNAAQHVGLFDVSLHALEHSERQGMTDDLFGTSERQPWYLKMFNVPVNVLWASAISLSSIWDIGNPAKTTGIVNWGGWLKGEAAAWKQIFQHPLGILTGKATKYAEYNALGAFSESYHDWTITRDDILNQFNKFTHNVGGTLLRASERTSQFRIARIADIWAQDRNTRRNLTPGDAEIMRTYGRLTEAQIAEISRGEMSERTRAVFIQAIVAQIAAFSEAPMQKGALQRHPFWRWAIRGIQVPTATLRQSLNIGAEIRDGLLAWKNNESGPKADAAKKQFFSALLRMANLTVVIGGMLGFGGMALRRVIKRRPIFQPDDPDTWYGWAALLLMEGGMFGPVGQLCNAAEYSAPDLRNMTYNLMFPVAVGFDMLTTAIGIFDPDSRFARDHPSTPALERMRRESRRFGGLIKVISDRLEALDAPHTDTFYRVRRWAQEWQKAQGVPYTGLSRFEARRKRIYPYDQLHRAVRDGNDAAIDESVQLYADYARKQGWDADEAGKRIKGSLRAKQPILLRADYRKTFLDSLSADRRAIAEMEMSRYNDTSDEALRRLKVLYGTQ